MAIALRTALLLFSILLTTFSNFAHAQQSAIINSVNGSILVSAPMGDVEFSVFNSTSTIAITGILSSIVATQLNVAENQVITAQQTSNLQMAILSNSLITNASLNTISQTQSIGLSQVGSRATASVSQLRTDSSTSLMSTFASASSATSSSILAISQLQSTAMRSLSSNLTQAMSLATAGNQATQSSLLTSLNLVTAQAAANISQLRADASAALSSALFSVRSTTSSLGQNITSGLSRNAAQITNLNSTQIILVYQLRRNLNCQSQFLEYNATSDSCYSTNVQLLPNDNVTFPCTTSGVLTYNSGTNVVSLCSSKTDIPQQLVPAAVGTQQNPAMSCGDIYGQGMPNQYYFVGSPYRRVFCRNGVTSWQPPFDILGNPFAAFTYDIDTSDTQGGVATTPAGTPLTYQSGRVGNSAAFVGNSTQFINASIPGTFWTNAWTVAGWFRFTTVNRGGTANDNAVLGSFGATLTNLALHLGERTGRVQFGFFGNDLLGTIPLAAGVWTHIVWTYDGSATKSIYVNGQFDTSQIGADFAGVSALTYIGAYGFSPLSFMAGNMDDLLIFSKTLSPAQVFTLFSSYRRGLSDDILTCTNIQTRTFPNWFYTFPGSGNPPTVYCASGIAGYFAPIDIPGLMPLNYFPFNGNAADALSTLVLTPRGTISYVSLAKQGSCAVFDGATTFFIYPGISPFVFQYGFSVAAWVLFNAVNRGAGSSLDNSVFGAGNTVGTNSLALHLGERQSTVIFAYYANDVQTGPILTANTWYHIVWTGQVNGCRSIYVNGQAQPLIPTGSALTGTSFNSGLVAGCGVPFQGAAGMQTLVGAYTFNSVSRMSGRIDELQVFSNALSPSDVAQLYAYS